MSGQKSPQLFVQVISIKSELFTDVQEINVMPEV